MSLLPFRDPFSILPSSFYRPHDPRMFESFFDDDPYDLWDNVWHSWVRPFVAEANRILPGSLIGQDLSWDKEGNMSMNFEASGFKPEEIQVDLEGRRLKVRGEHSEKSENGYIQRKFEKMVKLPEDVKLDEIKCELDEKGYLNINIPRAVALEESKKLPIEQKKKE
uniref:SHSP domain-containing protein n=2 Tax=Bursaphelenchus xylophilus TaxID=6326 RepID=A0A1I7RQA3_BURXY